jgi:hypothetical protein
MVGVPSQNDASTGDTGVRFIARSSIAAKTFDKNRSRPGILYGCIFGLLTTRINNLANTLTIALYLFIASNYPHLDESSRFVGG